MEVRDLDDFPLERCPTEQLEGLKWFLVKAEAFGPVGVIPNWAKGVIIIYKGTSLEAAERVALVDRQGDFLDPRHGPDERQVVLSHADYIGDLRIYEAYATEN